LARATRASPGTAALRAGADNKSIAALPDVCLSPPAPPAGPLPIPYPNTAIAADTTNGSKTVTIGGKEVGLKNKSSYKKSNGNEPATKNFGAGVVSHNITGAVYFSAYSFDMKVEGENVPRFGDLTTGNHMSSPAAGNAATTTSIAGMDTAQGAVESKDCKELRRANADARSSMQSAGRKRSPETPHQGLQTVGGSNTTITHDVYTNGNGISGVVRACSNAVVEKYDNSFSPFPGKKDGPSNMNGQGECGVPPGTSARPSRAAHC
jgi:hypothetical protein